MGERSSQKRRMTSEIRTGVAFPGVGERSAERMGTAVGDDGSAVVAVAVAERVETIPKETHSSGP